MSTLLEMTAVALVTWAGLSLADAAWPRVCACCCQRRAFCVKLMFRAGVWRCRPCRRAGFLP